MHTGSDRLLFLNVASSDVAAARAFFAGLGFSFDDRFCDERTACLVLNEKSYVMILDRARFTEFAAKDVADPLATTEVLLCVSAESRQAVDQLVDRALAAGGSPAGDPMDQGFMYGRSFNDLDGHHWEVMWMSPEAVEQMADKDNNKARG